MPAREPGCRGCRAGVWAGSLFHMASLLSLHGWTSATALKVGGDSGRVTKASGTCIRPHPDLRISLSVMLLSMRLFCNSVLSDEQTHLEGAHLTDGAHPLGWGHVAVVGVSLLGRAPLKALGRTSGGRHEETREETETQLPVEAGGAGAAPGAAPQALSESWQPSEPRTPQEGTRRTGNKSGFSCTRCGSWGRVT